MGQSHAFPQGLKPVDLVAFMYGLKPVPFKLKRPFKPRDPLSKILFLVSPLMGLRPPQSSQKLVSGEAVSLQCPPKPVILSEARSAKPKDLPPSPF